jgi:ribosomal-protein-alanine N-acetyltransferase
MALLFGRRAESVLPALAEDAPESPYAIEPATQADLAGMDQLEREAFATPWSLDLMRGALGNHRYRVRVLRGGGGQLMAFYIAHTTDRTSNLDNLVVKAGSRRKGYGRHLLVDWIAHARRQRLATLSLQVNTRNQAAERLYRRFSFTRVRLLPSYYPDGEDAFQMERELAV